MTLSTATWLTLLLVSGGHLSDGAAPPNLQAAPETIAVSFEADILPIFTRVGCNAGACHGAAAGRGGLQLSLFGSRPRDDYDELVREWGGRRVQRGNSAQSLVLLKPSEQVAHEGGRILPEDASDYQSLAQWINTGADYGPTPQLMGLRLRLPRQTSTGSFEIQQNDVSVLTVPQATKFSIEVIADELPAVPNEAFHRTGRTTSRNVTRLTQIRSLSGDAVAVEPSGRIQVRRPGIHIVAFRYRHQQQILQLIVPFRKQPSPPTPSKPKTASIDIDLNEVPPPDAGQIARTIDEHLQHGRQLLGVTSAPPTSATSFHRRTALLLTGRLPHDLFEGQHSALPVTQADALSTAEAVTAEVFIDRVIRTRAFDVYWTSRLSEWMQFRARSGEDGPARAFYEAMATAIQHDQPIDELMRLCITASGSARENAYTYFLASGGSPGTQAEKVARVFAGIRIGCANCHDHPLDLWTQDHYHGLKAIFEPLTESNGLNYGSGGIALHPRTGKPAAPRILNDTPDPTLSVRQDLRSHVAASLVASPDLFLARNIVNRVWRDLFGRGLVDPVDDLRITNPATHPRLLAALASQFSDSNYDLRMLIRGIAISDAFRRSSDPSLPPQEARLTYAAWSPIPLRPEVYLDATRAALASEHLSDDNRILCRWNPAHPDASLDALGRCSRAPACSSTNSNAAPLAAALHLLNGDALNEPLGRSSWIAELTTTPDATPAWIARKVWRRLLSRDPTPSEFELLRKLATAASKESPFRKGQSVNVNRIPRGALEDLVWSLLTSDEFRNVR